MEGHGQVGTRMLAASASLVANMTAASQTSPSTVSSVQPAAPTSTSTSTVTSTTTSTPLKTSATPPSTLSALAAKQHRLQETINEQKTLMASLETASANQKKDIMAKLRKLGEEMTSLAAPPSLAPETTIGLQPGGKKSGFDKMTEHERKERERLDKELDMNYHHQDEDKTEDLKAKLETL